MNALRWVATVALAVLLASGCGGSSQSETDGEASHTKTRGEGKRGSSAAAQTETVGSEVNVTVEGWEGPSDLGIIAANQEGFFEDEGINPVVLAPSNLTWPIKYVSEGNDDFGVAPMPQVALASEKGAPIVSIGSLISKPTAAMIWLPSSGIESLADLKGKTIAIPGLSFQKDFLADLLAGAGLTLKDVQVKSVGYELVPALLSGRAAAIFGGSWNLEGARLEELGTRPVITRMKSLGAPSYEELVVITRKDLLAEHPGLVRRFMSAVRRGTDAALKNPKAAVRVIEETDEADPKTNPKLTRTEVKATLPLLSRTGRIDPHKVSGLIHWMHEKGMVRRELPVSELVVNLQR